MSDIVFANGLIFKKPDNAPDFVIGNLSVKKSEFIPFLDSQDGDWVNLQIKLSKGGKYYVEVNNWKPDKDKANPQGSKKRLGDDIEPLEGAYQGETNDDLPF